VNREDALAAIRAERDRQSELWAAPHAHGQGDCSSAKVSLMVKVAVLAEECGEVARAALDGDPEQMATELVQVAAVALAILEGEPGCTCYLGREIPGTDTTSPGNCAVHGQMTVMPAHDQGAWDDRLTVAAREL
jgi:hypothetical protein